MGIIPNQKLFLEDRIMVRLLFSVVLIFCCCEMALAQSSVLVPTPAQQPPAQAQQLPQPQPPVVVQPPVVAAPTVAVTPVAQPVWFIKKKFFGFGYRARPGWVHTTAAVSAPPPPIVTPVTVMRPVTTYVYRYPQPYTVVRPHTTYRAETHWRY